MGEDAEASAAQGLAGELERVAQKAMDTAHENRGEERGPGRARGAGS
jgi:hypothetical protein